MRPRHAVRSDPLRATLLATEAALFGWAVLRVVFGAARDSGFERLLAASLAVAMATALGKEWRTR